MASPDRVFVRDRFTYLAYGMLAYYGYFVAAFGPIVPFLRSQLALSYTVSGLHFSAYGAGVTLVSVFGDRLARRWGRYRAFWSGGLGLSLGAVGLVLGSSVLATIPSIFVMGLGGGLLLIMIQATLADYHGAARTQALTEANVLASVSGTIAPALVGRLQDLGVGWRSALVFAVAVFALAFVAMRRVRIPEPALATAAPGTSARLPGVFWLFWLIIFVCVAIEWCVLFWAAEFLTKVVGLAETDAATTVSVFLGAMLIGRIVGSILARTIPVSRLLAVALGIVAVGFPIFWLAPIPWLNVAGLFVTGLGVANLYPFGLSVAMSTAPHAANLASASLTLGSSMATVTLPFVLGWTADQIGIGSAYGMVIGLVALAMALLVAAAWRMTRTLTRATPEPADIG